MNNYTQNDGRLPTAAEVNEKQLSGAISMPAHMHIEAIEGGFIVQCWGKGNRKAVASTPAKLVAIVRGWAVEQQAEPESTPDFPAGSMTEPQ